MVQQVTPPRTVDWPAIRQDFVTRPERPTYAELAESYAISEQRIKRAAADEGWAVARAAFVERQLAAADAGSVVLLAVRADAAILRGCTDLGLAGLERLRAIVTDETLAKRAPSTQSQVVNTCMFAFANLTKALKDAGVSGLPQQIRESAQKGNGQWDSGLLQQINVTVQNLQAAETAQRSVTAANPPPSGDARHGNTSADTPPAKATLASMLASALPATDVSASVPPPAVAAPAGSASAPESTPTPPAG